MYSALEKENVFEMFGEKSVKEISELTSISVSTLYKWKKVYDGYKLVKSYIENEEYDKAIELAGNFSECEPIQSQLMTVYMKKKEYDNAIELAGNFSEYEPIQSQLITVYMKKKEYDKAIELAGNFSEYEPIQSQLITIYMKKGKYDKAIEIAGKFTKYAPIQSQLITIYMKKGEYDKAIELAGDFPEYETIQSQLMTVYIEIGEYDKVIEIAEKFPDDKPIQSQLMTVYTKKKEYDKAIEIAEKFSDDKPIQSQLITVYMKKKEYDKVIEIARKFPKCEPIQSQLITVYMKKKEYDKAIELAGNFPEYETIQSQLMTVYIEIGEYDKAIEIAEKFPDDKPIQSQLMTVYTKKKEYDKAIERAGKFPKCEPIQGQLMTVYIETGEYDKAIEIAEKFSNNEFIQKKIGAVKKNLNMDNTKNEDISASKQNTVQNGKIDCYELNVIRTKLVANTISMKDIELLDKVRNQIGDKKYILVLAAIYERLNLKKKCIEILSELSVSRSRKIKKIIQEVENKKKYYDIAKWDSIIGWSRNEIIDIVDEEKNTSFVSLENEGVVLLEEKPKNQKRQSPKKIICSDDILPVNSYVPSSKKKKQVSSEIKNTLYDVLDNNYKDLCFYVQRYLYVRMQDDSSRIGAIKVYDRLEELLCRDSSDEDSKQKVLEFLCRTGEVIANEIGCDDKISLVIERGNVISRTRKKDIN